MKFHFLLLEPMHLHGVNFTNVFISVHKYICQDLPTIEINSTVSTLFEANAWPVVVVRGRGKRWGGKGEYSQ